MTTKAVSTDFTWITSQDERFDFMGGRWDVTAAKKLLASKARKVDELVLNRSIRDWVPLEPPVQNDEGGIIKISLKVRIDESLLEDADLDLPLIVIVIGKGDNKSYLPIDGWHRITKAARQGLESLPAVLLTAAESKRIRIG